MLCDIKIEYDLDQVNEKISKIIDNLCTIFSSLPTTHFLEFKKILPSQREKIVKEHSAKLNEFFNSDKNKNKSFLEVTEALKATDQMEWVRRINNIKNRAEEIVFKELIYT